MKSYPCDMHTYASKLKPLVVDSTDNKSKSTRCCSEKYSLRHRKRKTHVQNKKQKKLESPVCTNENSNTEYDSLFPQCALLGKKNTAAKNKPKAAPLSKYRRKTANARERTRMREINLAFENLRLCVPNAICGEEAGVANEKLTKITTLRLAMKYIDILTETLKNPTLKSDFLLHCIVEGNHHRLSNLTSEENGTINSSIQNVGTNIEYKIYRSKNENLATKSNPIANSRKTKKLKMVQKKPQSPHKKTTNSKKITQNNTNNEKKLLQNERFPLNYLLSPTLSLCSTSSSSISQSSKSFAYSPLSTNSSPLSTTGYKLEYNSKSSSHPNLSNKSTGLNDPQSFLLESDGESLNLSENCFSPIEESNKSHIAGRKGHVPFQICGNDSELPMSSFGNPLELNLRLIQAKSETTDFITDIAQQPPLCISPLATLDAFSPFGDLLHGDFPEPNSLDLFLT